jgi:Protein of unknown function (DUF3347)
MKNLKTTFSILIFTMLIMTVTSCKNDAKKADSNGDEQTMEMNSDNEDHNTEMGHDNSDGHHDNDNDNASSDERDIAASTQKNGDISEIIDSYLQIKNALVSDDKDGAAKGASVMLMAFLNFDMSQLSGAQHKEYMEIYESAKEQAEHIVKSPIDHQREHFETMSTDVNDLITLLGTDKTLYVDYCPMKKVSWLSETEEIKNPFYGTKMMTCGNIKKQIN